MIFYINLILFLIIAISFCFLFFCIIKFFLSILLYRCFSFLDLFLLTNIYFFRCCLELHSKQSFIKKFKKNYLKLFFYVCHIVLMCWCQKIKKKYLNAFLSKKHFEKQHLPHSQTLLWHVKLNLPVHNVGSTSQYNLLYWFILEFNYVFFPFLTSISFLLIIVTIFVF